MTAPTSPNPYIACIVNNIEPYHDLKQEEEGLNKEALQNHLRIRNNGQHSTADPKPSQVG